MEAVKEGAGFSLVECMVSIALLGFGIALLSSAVIWTRASTILESPLEGDGALLKSAAYRMAEAGLRRKEVANVEIEIYYTETSGIWFFRWTGESGTASEWQGPYFENSLISR